MLRRCARRHGSQGSKLVPTGRPEGVLDCELVARTCPDGGASIGRAGSAARSVRGGARKETSRRRRTGRARSREVLKESGST